MSSGEELVSVLSLVPSSWSLDSLPFEILLVIVESLRFRDLVSLCHVCRGLWLELPSYIREVRCRGRGKSIDIRFLSRFTEVTRVQSMITVREECLEMVLSEYIDRLVSLRCFLVMRIQPVTSWSRFFHLSTFREIVPFRLFVTLLTQGVSSVHLFLRVSELWAWEESTGRLCLSLPYDGDAEEFERGTSKVLGFLKGRIRKVSIVNRCLRGVSGAGIRIIGSLIQNSVLHAVHFTSSFCNILRIRYLPISPNTSTIVSHSTFPLIVSFTATPPQMSYILSLLPPETLPKVPQGVVLTVIIRSRRAS